MSTEIKSDTLKVEIQDVPPRPSRSTTSTSQLNMKMDPNNAFRTRATVTYFEGPRDIQKHSKLPLFFRLHGGILPKMILPLIFVGSWATAVTLIHKKVSDVGVDTVLLTVLGFVVAFAVSFRSSTAYERYSEGRRYWSQLILTCRNLGRHVWLNMGERDSEEDPLQQKKELLGKITAMNLIAAFPIALKHRLRFEPAFDYEDLEYLISSISATTMASKADQSKLKEKEPSTLKQIGQYLGLPFAESNPRKLIKRSEENLGNLPHEILVHLSVYIDSAMATKQIYGPNKFFWSDLRAMSEILTGVERILNTPLPLAYTISIAQITWMYIMVLPFQLVKKLGWVSIPATMLAAYIILGLAMIGQEIENPFGNDVNDLPLEQYCEDIKDELDTLMGHTVPEYGAYEFSDTNRPLYPISWNTTKEWQSHDMDEVRAILRARAADAFARKRKRTAVVEEV